MRRIILFTGLLSFTALAACSPPTPAHDKAYFVAHDADRAAQVAACQADPGRLAATPACINAQAADAEVHAAHFYDAPKPASRVQKPGSL
jgi:hypothetical protein